ncbi:MAG: Spy/CpxP family protein refolding chaperone [Stellaceae bacterium]
MTKINRFAIPAFALAAALSIGSAVGLAQTNMAPAQSNQSHMGPGMMPEGGTGPGMMSQGGMGPGMMSQGGTGPGMMAEGGMGPAMCAAMAGHVDGRLAYLKAELKITEAQEPLWNAYAAAARDNAKDMLARCTTMTNPKGAAGLSLPDRLDRREQFMAARLDSLRAMDAALKPLYAALGEDQKKTADQMSWGPMGPMGMMGMMGKMGKM